MSLKNLFRIENAYSSSGSCQLVECIFCIVEDHLNIRQRLGKTRKPLRKDQRSARKFPRPRPDSGPSTARTADSAARAASAPAPWRCALPARHGDKRQAPASADSPHPLPAPPSGISGSAGADSCVSCAGSACAAFRSSSSFCALCARSASSDASCESVTIAEKVRCLLPSASPAPP